MRSRLHNTIATTFIAIGWWGFHTRLPLAILIAGLCSAGVVLTAAATGEERGVPPPPGSSMAAPSPSTVATAPAPPSVVLIERPVSGPYRYLVNGEEQLFIGMGYNPIYRYLSPEERAERYHHDFALLCGAGVNHIIGWDFDKGYEQDKFDELTLDIAHEYGIGVVMPFYLPPEGDYREPGFRHYLIANVHAKVARFKDHPALRMWGLGNEVLMEMPPRGHPAFIDFYPELADRFHQLDPDHPVIYREGEDVFVEAIASWYTSRPWLLYGMHIYRAGAEELLDRWPSFGLDRPLFVDEFGAEHGWFGTRAEGYVEMWRKIRAYDYVLGGAPYTWTTEGPEPTDAKWGLMDGHSHPVDAAFPLLTEEWLAEPGIEPCAPAAAS